LGVEAAGRAEQNEQCEAEKRAKRTGCHRSAGRGAENGRGCADGTTENAASIQADGQRRRPCNTRAIRGGSWIVRSSLRRCEPGQVQRVQSQPRGRRCRGRDAPGKRYVKFCYAYRGQISVFRQCLRPFTGKNNPFWRLKW
jgi:hypothetical protein